jgi:hypothetical protein
MPPPSPLSPILYNVYSWKAPKRRQDLEANRVKIYPNSNSEKGRKDEKDENRLVDHG